VRIFLQCRGKLIVWEGKAVVKRIIDWTKVLRSPSSTSVLRMLSRCPYLLWKWSGLVSIFASFLKPSKSGFLNLYPWVLHITLPIPLWCLQKNLYKSSDFLMKKKKVHEWMHVCMIMLKYIENRVWLGP